MRNIVVTGITGKSGRAFLACLTENASALSEMRFRFAVRTAASLPGSFRFNAEVALCDITDESALPPLFDFPDGETTLLHIAGIRMSIPLVRAALTAGVRNLILVHTTGIYSRYKAAGELYRRIDAEVTGMVAKTGGFLSILRPTMIYGTLSDGNISVFLRMADRLRLFPVVGGGRYALQPVSCLDLGRAYFDILTHEAETKGKDYILSGGAPIDFIELLRVLARGLGKKTRFVPVPFPIAYSGAWGVYILTLGRVDYRERVQRLVEPRVYSHEDATRDFGYAPLPFEEGVKGELADYLAARTGRRTKGD